MNQQQPPQSAPPRAQAQHPAGSAAKPGDEVLFTGRARHTASVMGYLKWSLVGILGGVGAWGLAHVEFFSTWPLWVLSFAGVPGIIWTYLRHTTTHFKITHRRVEYERGVLNKDVDSLELWRVLDVRFKQNLLDRVLGNARIVLIGTDQSDPELQLYGLPDARALFEQLRDAVQAARHTSRPMEVVGQDGAMENFGMGDISS